MRRRRDTWELNEGWRKKVMRAKVRFPMLHKQSLMALRYRDVEKQRGINNLMHGGVEKARKKVMMIKLNGYEPSAVVQRLMGGRWGD
jgi:hypothetical protein